MIFLCVNLCGSQRPGYISRHPLTAFRVTEYGILVVYLRTFSVTLVTQRTKLVSKWSGRGLMKLQSRIMTDGIQDIWNALPPNVKRDGFEETWERGNIRLWRHLRYVIGLNITTFFHKTVTNKVATITVASTTIRITNTSTTITNTTTTSTQSLTPSPQSLIPPPAHNH